MSIHFFPNKIWCSKEHLSIEYFPSHRDFPLNASCKNVFSIYTSNYKRADILPVTHEVQEIDLLVIEWLHSSVGEALQQHRRGQRFLLRPPESFKCL